MSETKFTNKQKEEILTEVLKKTNQYYEQSVQEQEDAEQEAVLEKELDNL